MNVTVIASGSSGNAYKIDDGETALLLDAGIPIKRIKEALRFRVRELSGCLVTHCHGDHAKAAGDLAALGVDIYTSRGTIEAASLSGHRIKPVCALKEFSVGSFTVLPFDVQHDVPEPLGFLVASKMTGEKLLYFTDTYYLKYTFVGVKTIIGECNYDTETMWDKFTDGDAARARIKRLFQSHMSLDTFLDFLKAMDRSSLEEIYICHMSNDNGNESLIKEAVKKLTGAVVHVC